MRGVARRGARALPRRAGGRGVNTLELAERAAQARRTRRTGAGHARALAAAALRARAGRPSPPRIDDVTVEIAVPLRGNVGRAATNAVDDESLARLCRRVRGWRPRPPTAAHDGSFPGFSPQPEAAALRPFDPATAELDPATGGAALADAFVEAEAHGRRGPWNLDGRRAGPAHGPPSDAGGEERRTDAFMKVICIAPNGRSGYASQAAVAVARAVDAGALAERAAAQGGFRRRARGASCRASTRSSSSPRRWAGCSTCSGETAFNGLASRGGARSAWSGEVGRR